MNRWLCRAEGASAALELMVSPVGICLARGAGGAGQEEPGAQRERISPRGREEGLHH